MQIDFKVNMNPHLFLKDPLGTETGKQILNTGVKLMAEIGYELFTFKKLAFEMKSTEATVYRYFENKHKFLIYLIDWYWSYLEFQVIQQSSNGKNAAEKIKSAIRILSSENKNSTIKSDLNIHWLFKIAMAEGSKTYLTKEVDEHNKDFLYKPYKDLCASIAVLFKEYNF